MIFVFGSNLAGRHGAGSALYARLHHGAIYGKGIGRQGNSYAIPTKDGRLGTPNLRDPRATLPLTTIAAHVQTFIEYAIAHPELEFQIVKLGCSLACHNEKDIAPMFINAPNNCHLPDGWREIK